MCRSKSPIKEDEGDTFRRSPSAQHPLTADNTPSGRKEAVWGSTDLVGGEEDDDDFALACRGLLRTVSPLRGRELRQLTGLSPKRELATSGRKAQSPTSPVETPISQRMRSSLNHHNRIPRVASLPQMEVPAQNMKSLAPSPIKSRSWNPGLGRKLIDAFVAPHNLSNSATTSLLLSRQAVAPASPSSSSASGASTTYSSSPTKSTFSRASSTVSDSDSSKSSGDAHPQHKQAHIKPPRHMWSLLQSSQIGALTAAAKIDLNFADFAS